MDSLMKMQNLAVTVNGLKESIHLQSVRVNAISSENIHAASKYHSTFGELLNKYCIFANEYKSQLTNLHESLLNEISIAQKEREEKLELLSCKSSSKSNSPNNLEIVENVEENEYFCQNCPNLNSMNSINNSNINLSSSDYSESCDINIDASISSEIEPMQSKKSIPISPKPSPKKNENEEKNKVKKSTEKKNDDIKEKVEENNSVEDNKYVYNARNIKFNLPFKVWNNETKKYEKKVYKHTTMIFIGNISLNVKVYALKQFLIKKFEITLKQIVNTRLYRARNGLNQYALVMFKGDITKDYITKYMDIINSDNAKIKANKNKNAVKASWQSLLYIKYQDPEYHYSNYRNSYEMYNDSRVRHELFIRNFDILGKKFHRKFTEKLLKYGDLYEDINVNIDHYGNPYCIVTFKYKNDAVNVCNSEIYFGDKRLDIRYSNKITYLDDLIKHQYQ